MRRQVNLVDDQKVAGADARTALAGDLVSLRDINHKNEHISQFSRKDGGEIVAPGFNDHHFEVRKLTLEVGDRAQVAAGVVANGRVRAAAGLNADNPFQGQNLASREELGVFMGVDIISDDCNVDFRPELLAEPFHHRGFPRADGAGHAQGEGIAAGSCVPGRAGTSHVVKIVRMVMRLICLVPYQKRCEPSPGPAGPDSQVVGKPIRSGRAGNRAVFAHRKEPHRRESRCRRMTAADRPGPRPGS